MRGKIQVSEDSLQTLLPGALIDGTALEAYLRQIERRSGVKAASSPIISLDPFFFVDLDRQRLDLVAKRFKTINPFSKEIILVPLHTAGNPGHWSLICARPQQRRLEAYDSLKIPHKNRLYQFFHVLKRYAKTHDIDFSDPGWHLQETPHDTPTQTDAIECGAYVAWFAERISRGLSVTAPGLNFDPKIWRQHMVETIRCDILGPETGADLERKFLSPPAGDPPASLPTISIVAIDTSPAKTLTTTETNNDVQGPSSWDTLVEEILSLTASMQNNTEDSQVADPGLELAELFPEFTINTISTTQVETSMDTPSLSAVEQMTSPCLSLTVEDVSIEDCLEDAMRDIDTDPLTPLVVKPLLGIDTAPGPSAPPTPLPEDAPRASVTRHEPTTSNEANRRRRKREKKVKIFFPGHGWRKLPKRLVRPDLKW